MVFDKCKNSRPSNNLSSGPCSVALSSWRHMPHGVFSKTTLYPNLLSFFREHRQTDTLPHHNNINHCLSLLWNQGHGHLLTLANLSPVLSHLLLPSVTTLPFPPFFYLLCFLFFGECWFGWCIRQDPSRKQMNTQISTIWKRFNTVPNYKGIETSRVTIVPRG